MEWDLGVRLRNKQFPFQKKFFFATHRFMNGECGYFRDMIVSIGCDHAGPELKARIAQHLEAQGHTMLNRGTDTPDSVDDPCLLYTSPSPRDYAASRMPSSA